MIAKAKGVKGKCDALFSRLVRSPGICRRCGGNEYLQCAHIISRRYSATRCDLRNAWCLCASCHRRLTDWPREHSHFISDTIGSGIYDELKAKAETVTKVDWQEVYDSLKETAKEMGIKV